MRTICFKVESKRGLPFPVDMLRYSEAWPSTSDDAARISLSIAHSYGAMPSIKDNFVWLVTDRGGDREFNAIGRNIVERFDSFGWKVTCVHVAGGDEIDPVFYSRELTQS